MVACLYESHNKVLHATENAGTLKMTTTTETTKQGGSMLPAVLIGLAIGAGFLMKKSSSQSKRNNETDRRGLTYSEDVVTRAIQTPPKKTVDPSIEVTPEYSLVSELVKSGFPITFVTGGAGTGKSTMIRWLVNEFQGSVLVAAPTGIAAINIEGKTLHSLCQLPPAWVVQDDIKEMPRRREIREAKLLIIDEISMVTANLLDGVSEFFRKNRRIDKPFGGLPVIMVGDMFQLPPVVDESQRDMYEQVYGTPKFFNAKCLADSPYYGFELEKSYRQTDDEYISVLGDLREGRELKNAIKIFNSKCAVTAEPPVGAVWLSPRNAEVDHLNRRKLREIHAVLRTYTGSISGQFKNDRLPSPMQLELKVGAQVMFTKNDLAKQWVNGTIGRVCELKDDIITVELGENGVVVDVCRSQWCDYRYQWNAKTHAIDRTEIGNYTQFPLVMAWAMTVHKSQGKTIERVHLDLGAGAFETGQTYVALSRCRSISGLTLARQLRPSDVRVDTESTVYYKDLRDHIKKLPPEQMMDQVKSSRR